MAILLDDLLESISRSVSNANTILEQTALEQYMTQGYRQTGLQSAAGDGSIEQKIYTPITYGIKIQDGQQYCSIPVSALLHNATMCLEQVEVKLKFKMAESGDNIYIDCNTNGVPAENLNEMNLSFSHTSSPEGIAKLTDNHLKKI